MMWTTSQHKTTLNDQIGSYNSLKDPHLHSYFRKPIIRRHLLKANIINKDNKIVDEVNTTKQLQNLKRKQKRELYQLLEKMVKRNEQLEQFNDDTDQLEELVDQESLIKQAKTVFVGNDSKLNSVQYEVNGDRSTLLYRLDRMIRTIKEHNHNQIKNLDHHRYSGSKLPYSTLMSSKSCQDINRKSVDSKKKLIKSYSSTSQLSKMTRPKSSYGRQRKSSTMNRSNPNLYETVKHIDQTVGSTMKKSKSIADLSNEEEEEEEENSLNDDVDIESLDGESLCDSDDDIDAYSQSTTVVKPLVDNNKKYYAFDKRFVKTSSRQRVRMTLKFNGLNNATNRGGKRNIKVYQQTSIGGNSILIFDGFIMPGDNFTFEVRSHVNNSFAINILVNGIRDLRLNTCCEHKHRRGTRLSHFTIVDVVGGRACISCQNFEPELEYSESIKYKQDLLDSLEFVETTLDSSNNTESENRVIQHNEVLNGKIDSIQDMNEDYEKMSNCEMAFVVEKKEANSILNNQSVASEQDQHETINEEVNSVTVEDNESNDHLVSVIRGDEHQDQPVKYYYISDETLPKVENLDTDSDDDVDDD